MLVLVFPLLDWFIEASEVHQRTIEFKLVRWSPLAAVVFFVGAIVAAWLEELFKPEGRH